MSARPSAEVRQEHADLIHRYCHALDTRDWDMLEDVFTADATCDYGATGQPSGAHNSP